MSLSRRESTSSSTADLVAGKKRGSAISELIKYWASSTQAPPSPGPAATASPRTARDNNSAALTSKAASSPAAPAGSSPAKSSSKYDPMPQNSDSPQSSSVTLPPTTRDASTPASSAPASIQQDPSEPQNFKSDVTSALVEESALKSAPAEIVVASEPPAANTSSSIAVAERHAADNISTVESIVPRATSEDSANHHVGKILSSGDETSSSAKESNRFAFRLRFVRPGLSTKTAIRFFANLTFLLRYFRLTSLHTKIIAL